MLTASTHSGAAAVWAGSSMIGTHRWVQAGIASINNEPFLYAESNGSRYQIQIAPWRYGRPVRVTVNRQGSRWRATVGSLRTPWLRLRGAVRLAALELVDGGHATAKIGARFVSG